MMEWYRGLEPRERNIALFGALAITAILLFLLVIEPLDKRQKQASIKYKAALNLQQTMQETANKAEVLRKQQSMQKPTVAADKLLGLLDQSMKTAGITKDLKSIVPEKNNRVRLRFDDVNFDAFIKWLVDSHNRIGINVDTLSVIDTSKPGRVKASLLIK